MAPQTSPDVHSPATAAAAGSATAGTPSPSSGPAAARPEHRERWQATAEAAGLLRDGVPVPTVFETMTSLAAEHGAVNLGQGFPDAPGPDALLELAAAEVRTGSNQYAPGTGSPQLRRAVAEHRTCHWGVHEDPDTQVLITTGATEAIAAAVLAFVGPGDEVVTVEPFYDAHAATIALAGGRHVTVPVGPPAFLPDPDEVAAAFTDRTRMLILNTPHNPTGAVYPRQLLGRLVALCAERGVLVLTDEVYDHLVFDGEHVTARAVPGAEDVVLTASSAGKSLAVTGWKVGWLVGPAELVAAARAVKQYLTFSSGPAYQEAVAAYLPQADAHLAEQRQRYRAGRDLLVSGLREAGLDPVVPQAGYFVTVDLSPWGVEDAQAAAEDWIRTAGVCAIPVSALCRAGGEHMRSWLRLAFCKDAGVIAEGMDRLVRHAASLRG
jgi:N-succinyldiaminopimelate aminotransferase